MSEINSITLEIIANGMTSIAEQMGVILTKTGYSTNIKERKDLSVAIFSPQGKLLALAQHIPLHFSSLSGAVEILAEKYDESEIHEGDVFIANDPYTGGGSHLPDIVILKPVFYKGKLVAFMVNTGHHADRSRRGPTVYDEGLRIPVIKLYDRGKLVRDVMDLIMLNFQMKYERHGDLNAQILTNQYGNDKLIELIDKIGLETYEEFCVKWLEYGEKKSKIAISELKDGEYEFEDYMDSDGAGHEDLKIKVKIIIKGDNITFDFTGTCKQVPGPYNCVPCALKATIYYSMLAVLDNSIPANSGFFDSINIIAEPGTLVWATEPAPVSDRESTTQRIADVIFGAFSKLDPKMVVAAGNGAQSFLIFDGDDKRFNRHYVYVETVGGGSGARYNKDGLDTVHVHMTNTSNLPCEALEMEYPLLVEKYAMSENSCGPGKYRGGTGIVRAIRVIDESENTSASAATERSKYKPWGLEGGQEGGNSSLRIYRDGKLISDNPKPRNIPLRSGDVVELRTAGAGGYGPVSERDPDIIRQELRDGIIDDKWISDAGLDPNNFR
ncbi:MAG: hydantoinase B/oxoprolinase family protein [Clostridia bacterium]|nr:hydantoinase B/oxoprolinase family protein [Clostridia bacterium]